MKSYRDLDADFVSVDKNHSVAKRNVIILLFITIASISLYLVTYASEYLMVIKNSEFENVPS